jgi:ZIP family zinc transporter
MIYAIAAAAFTATFIGGIFALYLRDRLHLILGFSAGAVIGVAFFDLLPEAIEMAASHYELGTVTAFVALGFVIYLVLDRFMFAHSHVHTLDGHDHHHHQEHAHATAAGGVTKRGLFGAGSLSFHSFLDGVGVGLAFQVSPTVGIVVATAVLMHDFSDGINTVSIIIKNGGTKLQAYKWLALDAIAPVLGILAGSLIVVPEQTLGMLLALFCGFFLYIGASELLPESYHSHPKALTTVMTILGMVTMYVAITLAGH